MNPKSVTNVLVCGVGGQGVLTATEVLANVCLQSGFDVKKSEVHGMAQRGGDVVSHVRFGPKVYSPLIKAGLIPGQDGEADFLLSFEQVEPLRYYKYLSAKTVAIVNTQRIVPTTVTSGLAIYPDNTKEVLEKKVKAVKFIDALAIAQKAGNIRAVNSVLLGALAAYLDIPKKCWQEVIKDSVPPKTVEVNLKAFNEGYNII